MKKFFKGIIVFLITLTIMYVGELGFKIEESDTTDGWKIWGYFLSFVITVPSAIFWLKQLAYVVDLKEEGGEK